MTGIIELEKDPRAELADGAFCRCDGQGRVLAASTSLEGIVGRPLDGFGDHLVALFGEGSRESLTEILEAPENGFLDCWLPYVHPLKGKRWLSLRRGVPTPDDEGVLLFVSDQTILHESLVKVAAAQSRDVENSARLQAAVLVEGRRIKVDSLDYQTSTMPSKLVDGDFLEVLRLAEGSLDFLLGDVMGKGMDAAIVGAMIKFGFIRSLAMSLFGSTGLPSPSTICSAAESEVAQRLLAKQSYATLTYARFHEASRAFMFVDCGHTSIVHHSLRTGECWRVKGGNMPLGFMGTQRYRDYWLPIDPGDSLLLFTDGLSECCNRSGEALGEERIAYMLRTYSGLAAADLAGTVMRIGFMYSAAGFNDDVSLICVKDRGTPVAGGMERLFSLDLTPPVHLDFGGVEAMLGEDLQRWIPALDDEGRAGIILAVHEALTNIAEHALAPGGGPCDMRWRCLDGLLSLELEYVGPAYDWVTLRSTVIQDFAGSGYGRYIMQEVMDSILVAEGFHDRKRLVMCRKFAERKGDAT